MAALTPGCRNGAGPVLGLFTPEDDPQEQERVARESIPVIRGPHNIAEMKQQVVDYRRTIMRLQRQIASIESALDLLDPAAVVAVPVPNYTDPPTRIDAATAARAASPSP